MSHERHHAQPASQPELFDATSGGLSSKACLACFAVHVGVSSSPRAASPPFLRVLSCGCVCLAVTQCSGAWPCPRLLCFAWFLAWLARAGDCTSARPRRDDQEGYGVCRLFALVRARRLRFASSVVINGRSKGVARASALPLPSACSIFLLRRRRSLWIALAPANRSIAMVFLFPRQASPPKLPPPLARSMSPTHTLFFCTAVTAAPRSLPTAPSRVFC